MVARRKILITGCGRSGTGFLAELLNRSGVRCGHEAVFDVYGYHGKDFVAESSWYAAPFIESIVDLTHVIHVVRDPIDVIRSFYRIGLFARSPVRHISYGSPIRFAKFIVKNPSAGLDRIDYVRAHRQYFRKYCDLFSGEKTEIGRLERYWRVWNSSIERSCTFRDILYLRVQLEKIVQSTAVLDEFLGVQLSPGPLGVVNAKSYYRVRNLPPVALNAETLALARRYGYAVPGQPAHA